MKKRIASLIISVCLCITAALTVKADTTADKQTALDGIYIENVNISGMSEEDIDQVVQAKIDELSQCRIELYVGKHGTTIMAGDLGLFAKDTKIARRAVDLGQRGNVLERFETGRQMKKGPLVLEIQYQVDQDKVKSMIADQCSQLSHPAINMSLRREKDGTFTPIPGQDGAILNEKKAVKTVMNFFSDEWRGGDAQITLDADIKPAQGDENQLSKVKDVLGESSTDYSSSLENRRTNIENGTEKLNGKVLYPGEELSVLESVTPFDEESGYAAAPSYEMGSVVDTYGGGICQVSTTLYLAVLRSELEVTERFNHSMLVNYVKPSMDAAIAEGSKDFKFKNNTDAPIYIQGYASNGELGFLVYGHETRDRENRTVTFESETTKTTDPNTQVREDSKLPFGQKEYRDGHIGKEAVLWKIVSENGQETREQVNESTYNMTPNLTSVGIKGGSTEAIKKLENAITANDPERVDEVLAQYQSASLPKAGSDEE